MFKVIRRRFKAAQHRTVAQYDCDWSTPPSDCVNLIAGAATLGHDELRAGGGAPRVRAAWHASAQRSHGVWFAPSSSTFCSGRHDAGLVRLGFVMLGDREASEDAVQDAFVSLHRNLPLMRDPEAAEAYLRSGGAQPLSLVDATTGRTARTDPPTLVRQQSESPEDTATARSEVGSLVAAMRIAAPAPARGARLPVRPGALRRRDRPPPGDQRGIGQDPHTSRTARHPATAPR